ncbi:DUF6232 family protein [Burkholderia glumae]|uniref:DUF6232 family protein n=1 Tax=Burkholderia glumae TaxID=337 RepID=UPI001570C315|nr:DUF6232 family protein [Burkholderia glumae]QKM52186.1 hypothetical protein CG017_00175 [Burkholderia glumae]
MVRNTTNDSGESMSTTVSQSNGMGETVFLQHGNVTVTNTRFIVPGQTYAMSNVTSIKHVEKAPSRALGVFVAIVGLLLLFAKVWVFGLAAIAIGVFVAWNAKGQYDVVLHTASGEVRAFQSPDRGLVQQIVSALNQAVVFRG